MSFVHLHLHTEYSMLDGASKIEPLAEAVKAKAMSAVAITDHGRMFGAIDFYKTMKKAGIKPIIGLEAYIHSYDDLGYKEPNDMPFKQRFHLCLFAKNQTGYNNLMRLSSESFLRGFYYYPRINKKLLEEFHEGLICTSACLNGEINYNLNIANERNREYRKGYEGALKVAKWYQELFGEDFYLELMRHGIEEQRLIDTQIIRLAKELNIKLIATNDTHYIERYHAEMQELLMCIGTGKKLTDEKRMRHSVKEFYLKSPDEMAQLFADIPEALANTQEIADKCNLELKLGDPTPPNYKFTQRLAMSENVQLITAEQYSHENDSIAFEYLCRKKIAARLAHIPIADHQRYYDRLELEIAVIKQMKFAGYMLIVWDFVNKAKELEIPVGPGRGSAAGSLVAFALEITNIDPIKYGLLFERFLNPERVSMPDIDMDFCQTRRGEVIEYVVRMYGRENVAQVITFGSLAAKNAIRDTGRVLDVPLEEVNALTKLFPDGVLDKEGKPKKLGVSLEEYYQAEPRLRELIETDQHIKEIWRFAQQLEGIKRNAGTHAAGVVISNEPLWHKTPLYRPSGTNDVVTQYDGHFLEDVDLIKFDFLGLQTLTVIDNALKLIAKRTKEKIDLDSMPMDDPKVFEMICTGKTLGIFQIESKGLQDLSRSLKPSCFEDLIAMIALYRPGPMESGMLDDFVERKHGRQQTTYMFPALEPILSATYGVIVYQEQVMQIVQTIGGFSLGKADLVRRAMGKKNRAEMDKAKSEFSAGAKANGYDQYKALELFDLIEKFAGYGFNKSHSAAYAMLTYQTAYLKFYYAAEFMSAMLTFDARRIDKVAQYINESRRMGIEILPPHINLSQVDFEPIDDGGKRQIVFGLSAIKDAGAVALEQIIKARDNAGGKFATLNDFISNIEAQKVNKKVIEALIKAGALDKFGYTRKMLLGSIELIVSAAQDASNIRKESKGGLFESDAEEMAGGVQLKLHDTGSEEFDQKELLGFEKDFLGLYVSGHPLEKYRQQLSAFEYTLTTDLDGEEFNEPQAVLIGKIDSYEEKLSKKGNMYAKITLLDLGGSREFTVFSRMYDKLKKLDYTNSLVALKVNIERDGVVEGRINTQVIDVNLIDSERPQKNGATSIKPAAKSAKPAPVTPITLSLAMQQQAHDTEILDKLYTIITTHPGKQPVMIRLCYSEQKVVLHTQMFASISLRAEAERCGVQVI